MNEQGTTFDLDNFQQTVRAMKDYIDDLETSIDIVQQLEVAKAQALTLPNFTTLHQGMVYGFMCQKIIELHPGDILADEYDWPDFMAEVRESVENEDLSVALYKAATCAILCLNRWYRRDDIWMSQNNKNEWVEHKVDDEWLERKLNEIAHTSTLPIPIILTTSISFGGITDCIGEMSQRIMVAERILKDYGYARAK